jgi:Replication-relaxation
VLKRLTELRVLARLDRRVGGFGGGSADYIYTLDVAGQKLAEMTERPRCPYVWYDPTIQHCLAVGEVYVRLIEAQHSGTLTLLGFKAEPYCWRGFDGQTLKPDAFLQVGVVLGEERRKLTTLRGSRPRHTVRHQDRHQAPGVRTVLATPARSGPADAPCRLSRIKRRAG